MQYPIRSPLDSSLPPAVRKCFIWIAGFAACGGKASNPYKTEQVTCGGKASNPYKTEQVTCGGKASNPYKTEQVACGDLKS